MLYQICKITKMLATLYKLKATDLNNNKCLILKTRVTHLKPLKKFFIRQELKLLVSKILHRNQ